MRSVILFLYSRQQKDDMFTFHILLLLYFQNDATTLIVTKQ